MLVHELRIQERETPPPEPRRQVYQGNFAGVRLNGKHAFAEKSTPQGNAVEAACEGAVLGPGFDAMRHAFSVHIDVKTDDVFVDPGIGARFGTGTDDFFEGIVESDTVRFLAQGFTQARRDMHLVDGQNAASFWIVPMDFPAIL